ncbi:MAG TPA: hypothetical protein DD439_00170, partial [Ruminococcaceae bacterium]|nr:hypothetical protein [Oscillospiraceae bacterium]
PLLRFAVSATGGAHLCTIQYYLRFWLGICRTSLAVSALRIMRYCPKCIISAAGKIFTRRGFFCGQVSAIIRLCKCLINNEHFLKLTLRKKVLL